MTDIFRKTYKKLSDEDIKRLDDFKELADKFYSEIERNTNIEGSGYENNGREMALAKTKLEECVMWAVKGITK